MRHQFTFDGMQAVDPGYMVAPQKSAIQIPDGLDADALAGMEIPELVETFHSTLRDEAYQTAATQHRQVFPYEPVPFVIDRLWFLCGPEAEVPTKSGESWRYGDALAAEKIAEVPEVQRAETLQELLNESLTEMLRNIYRRLHAHEAPIVLRAFQVFQQATQPCQVPLALFTRSNDIEPDELMQIIKDRPEFWKAELLDIATAYVSAMPGDPDAKSMQIASVYQRIKSLFEPEEPEPEQPEKEKKPRRLKHRPKA